MNTRQQTTLHTTLHTSIHATLFTSVNKTMMPSAGDLRGWVARACALVERRPGAGIG